MTEYKFYVNYVGIESYQNKMIVTALTKSLISLSDTLKKIQHISNPYETKLSFDIVAKGKGYFIIYLILDENKNTISRVMNFLTGQNSKSIYSLISYINIFGDIIEFSKKAFSHKIKSKNKLDNEKIKITLDDSTTIITSEMVLELYKDLSFRNSLREILQPLEKDSITKIDFYRDKKHKITVNKDDYKAFDILPKINVLETSKKTVYLQIINADFKNWQWKFSDWSAQFIAAIKDKDFLTSVKKNKQQFGALDTLKVQLETKQYINIDGKLKTEIAVVKVLEHKRGSIR